MNGVCQQCGDDDSTEIVAGECECVDESQCEIRMLNTVIEELELRAKTAEAALTKAVAHATDEESQKWAAIARAEKAEQLLRVAMEQINKGILRDAALEEAAQWVNRCGVVDDIELRTIAKGIRALKSDRGTP